MYEDDFCVTNKIGQMAYILELGLSNVNANIIYRILVPATSVFFASALPAIAFGELLNKKTGSLLITKCHITRLIIKSSERPSHVNNNLIGGNLSSVQTLASTAICGMIHSIIGGQPLLIQGVAEPTVLMYTFFYKFALQRHDLGHPLFLAWTSWVCVWTALLLMLSAIFNACAIIDRFTRMAEELIEILIALLFIQESIKGIVSEFQVPKGKDSNYDEYQFEWLYSNGLLAIIFSSVFLYTAFQTRKARSWWCGTGRIRNFIAEFGVPLMVIVWTAISYAVPGKVPSGVPRRLFSPQPWDSDSLHPWTIAKKMADVPPLYILGAFIPGLMLAGLFFFEHNVASKMAQQKDFNLKNPSAYHYDIFLLGFMTLICGLLGLPPSYATLPHSPMHTKSLAVLKRQLLRRKLVESAKESIRKKASNHEIYGKMQDMFLELDMNNKTNEVVKELDELRQAVMTKGENNDIKASEKHTTVDHLEKHIDNHLPVRVNEQRLSNLLQSFLLVLSFFAMPVIKRMPSSLLWGYLAYMAISSLSGNQFWQRIMLLFVPKCRLHKVLERDHPSYIESVPMKVITAFTVFQLVYLLICYCMTWIPLVGIIFPLPFFVLIIFRHLVLPKYFEAHHLHELDAVEYEEVLGNSKSRHSLRWASFSFRGDVTPDFGIVSEEEMEVSDSELLDELTTNRGELKSRTVSFRSEKCATSISKEEVKPRAMSFRFHDKQSKVMQVHPEDIV
ncbi:boron transporter 4-like [Silene latifolia]|uniref:boron transporter 4-like n=1 Tax=Silene latifolia TaxID=37657 RepID=UPI003D76CA02